MFGTRHRCGFIDHPYPVHHPFDDMNSCDVPIESWRHCASGSMWVALGVGMYWISFLLCVLGVMSKCDYPREYGLSEAGQNSRMTVFPYCTSGIDYLRITALLDHRFWRMWQTWTCPQKDHHTMNTTCLWLNIINRMKPPFWRPSSWPSDTAINDGFDWERCVIWGIPLFLSRTLTMVCISRQSKCVLPLTRVVGSMSLSLTLKWPWRQQQKALCPCGPLASYITSQHSTSVCHMLPWDVVVKKNRWVNTEHNGLNRWGLAEKVGKPYSRFLKVGKLSLFVFALHHITDPIPSSRWVRHDTSKASPFTQWRRWDHDYKSFTCTPPSSCVSLCEQQHVWKWYMLETALRHCRHCCQDLWAACADRTVHLWSTGPFQSFGRHWMEWEGDSNVNGERW